MNEILTKVCSKCGEEKPVEEFNKRSDRSGGRTGKCKKCNNEKSSKIRKLNGIVPRKHFVASTTGFKICTKCEEEKPTTEFYKSSGHKDGIQSTCKMCTRDIDKERSSKRQESYRLSHPKETVDTTHRVCSKCKIDKPIEQFWKDNSNKTYGRMSICIECRKKEHAIKQYPRIVEPRKKYEDKPGFAFCRTCGIEQPLSEFYKDESRKSGYGLQCKTCKAISDKEHYDKNRSEISKRHKEYRENNRDVLSKHNKEYRLEHIEEYKERDRVYAETHKEERANYNKKYRLDHRDELIEYGKMWRSNHKEECSQWSRQYYIDNKESISLYKKSYMKTPAGKAVDARHGHKRRSQHSKSKSDLTLKQWNKILEMQKYQCADCRKEFSKDIPPTRDHIIPLSLGGDLTFGNVQALCKSCNSRKHNKVDFMNAIDKLIEV